MTVGVATRGDVDRAVWRRGNRNAQPAVGGRKADDLSAGLETCTTVKTGEAEDAGEFVVASTRLSGETAGELTQAP